MKSFLPLLERPILEFLLSLYSSLKSVLLSVRFYSYFALFGFQWTHLSSQSFLLCLVGLDGLEPSTSRLSGARSSHLSYRPFCLLWWSRFSSSWWRWWESNPWPPACRAGALPAELHPHKGLFHLKVWSFKIEQHSRGFPQSCISLASVFVFCLLMIRHARDNMSVSP